jgi:hypothetical protein
MGEGPSVFRVVASATTAGAMAALGGGGFSCTVPSVGRAYVWGGLSAGVYQFQLGFDTIYGSPYLPTPFSVDVSVPPPGAFAALNSDWGNGFDLSSIFACGRGVADVVPASDGRLYVSSYGGGVHRAWRRGVYRVELDGTVAPIAGLVAASVSAGDGGPAIGAQFGDGGATALALDEANDTVLVNDVNIMGDGIVRAVNLATSTISTYAGGGTSAVDGAFRTSARLDRNITHLRRNSFDGSLWVASTTAVRRIDAVSGLVTSPISFTPVCGAEPALQSCDTVRLPGSLWVAAGCDVAFGADGAVYVAGRICNPSCASPVAGAIRIPSVGAPTVALGGCADVNPYTAAFDGLSLTGPVRALALQPDGSLTVSVDTYYFVAVLGAPAAGGASTVFRFDSTGIGYVNDVLVMPGGGLVGAGGGSLWRIW